MGEMIDKAKGAVNEAIGNAKQGMADHDQSPLAKEGRAQERKGEAQQVKGSVKGALGDKV